MFADVVAARLRSARSMHCALTRIACLAAARRSHRGAPQGAPSAQALYWPGERLLSLAS